MVIAPGGSVDLGGVSLIPSGSGAAIAGQLGDQLTIIKNDSGSAVSGTFVDLPEGSTLTVGTYTFSVSYQGGASQHDVVLTNIATTTTTLATTPNPSQFGQSVTFTATVSAGEGIPTGTVTFEDGGVPLPAGTVALATVGGQQVATYTTSALGLGPHEITADYNGATLFTTSQDSQEQDVEKADTTTQVSTSDPSTTYTATVARLFRPRRRTGRHARRRRCTLAVQ